MQKGHGFWEEYRLMFSGGQIPNEFQFKCRGSGMSFVVPPIITKKIVGVTVCVVSSSPEVDINLKLTNRSQQRTIDLDLRYSKGDSGEFTWLTYLPLPRTKLESYFDLRAGDEVHLRCYCDGPVLKCGTCLMYEGDEEDEAKSRPISPLFSYYYTFPYYMASIKLD